MNTIQSRSYSDPGYRLMVLLKSHLREILKRESDNSEAIFLYDTGVASLSDRQLHMCAHFLTEPTKGLGKIPAPRLSDTRYQTWRKRLIYNFKFQI